MGLAPAVQDERDLLAHGQLELLEGGTFLRGLEEQRLLPQLFVFRFQHGALIFKLGLHLNFLKGFCSPQSSHVRADLGF